MNIRERIAERTRNLKPAAEITLAKSSQVPRVPQTAPGKTGLWAATSHKANKLKIAPSNVRTVTVASIEPNPWDQTSPTSKQQANSDVLVRPHPNTPQHFQCVEKGWESISTQLSADDLITIIVGEFTDVEMIAMARYNPLT